MKILSIFFLLWASVQFGKVNENLLFNGGFEEVELNEKGEIKVKGWIMNGNGTFLSTEEVHSGKYSAKIFVPEKDFKKYSIYQEWKSEIIEISGKIKVSAWVKTHKVLKGEADWQKARVYFLMLDENKKTVPKHHQDICILEGSTDWKNYFWEGELPSEVKYIQIICSLSHGATGIVWFDDIEVIPLSDKGENKITRKGTDVEKEEEREFERLLLPKEKVEVAKGKEGEKLLKIEIEDVVLPPYKKIEKPQFFVETKDGIFWRGKEPVFLLGVESSCVLYPYLYKLLGIDFVCFDEVYPYNLTARYKKEGDIWKISWVNYPYLKTQIKLLLDYGIMPYIPFTEGRTLFPYNPLQKDFPELFAELGHYLDYSPLNPIGERLRWNNRKSILKDTLSYPIFAYELFNEVYYRCHDKYNLEIFRKEMEKKYKDISKANKVWGTSFNSFSEVVPPNPGHSLAFIINLPKDFSAMLYLDWMKVQEKIFGKYLEESYKKMKELAPDSFVTVQSHASLTLDYGDCGVYPGYKVKGEDIYGDENGQSLFFQEGEEDIDEINYMLRALLRYDIVRNFSPDKPIIDEESTLTGRGSGKVWEKEIVDLKGLWKFASAISINEGEERGWHLSNYDDNDWKEIKVPGLWGNQGYPDTKIGWYRKKFFIPEEINEKLKNGEKIYLKGRALTDKAYIYLDGSLIYTTKTWNEEFSLDISSKILIGGENTLAIKIINEYYQGGFYWGGIREYIKIVSSKYSEPLPINPEQMRAYLWSKVVHDYSGTVISYFYANEADPPKHPPFVPQTMSREAVKIIPYVKEEINSVGKIILPRPRIKGRIALLYPFETFRAHIPYDYNEFMRAPLVKNLTNYYMSLLFSWVPLDVIASDNILYDNIDKYRALIFANYQRVPEGVIEKLKRYIEKGGILIISQNSFKIDDEFNDPIPPKIFGLPEKIDTYYEEARNGKGKVYYLKDEFNFFVLKDIFNTIFKINNILPEFEVRDSSGIYPSFVEAHSFGEKGRYVWYFLNFGCSTNCVVLPKDLSSPLKGYTFLIRDVKTKEILPSPSGKKYWKKDEIEKGINLYLSCQSPKILLIEDASLTPIKLKEIDEEKKRVLSKIWNPTIQSDCRILIHAGYYERMSKEKIPTAVELLEKNGFGVYSILGNIEKDGLINVYDGENIKKDSITNYQILVFPCPQGNVTISKEVIDEIVKFVENGGGLLLLANFYHGPHGWLSPKGINYLSIPFGTEVLYDVFYDEINNVSGEPLWVNFQNFSSHPITSGIKTFSSGGCAVLKIRDKEAIPVIKSNKTTQPAEQPVLVIREYGRGRVVIIGDGYWLEPEFLKRGDNSNLLINIFKWLGKKM